jgi:UV DNA damage endonuclease
MKILQFNVAHQIYFFRISSDLVPFASHPICNFDWSKHFAETFYIIGKFIKDHQIRISMHPGQYTIINSDRPEVIDNSIRELHYHNRILDAMMLDKTAKIQIHVGGVYGNKNLSMERFVINYNKLDDTIKNRLVIENDDRLYKLLDCLYLSDATGVPVLFDVLHHELNNAGEPIIEALGQAKETWRSDDGIPMIDYSQSEMGAINHNYLLNIDQFAQFIEDTTPLNLDIMLEIKDKEASAMKAISVAVQDDRFFRF